MSICRSEALFSSYKDIPGPGTSESLIQVILKQLKCNNSEHYQQEAVAQHKWGRRQCYSKLTSPQL